VVAAPAGSAEPGPVSVNVQAGQVYGVGLPIVVSFTRDIPDSERGQVGGGLSVHSQPTQTGAWRWYGNRQLIYRPREYWRPGTRLTVHTALRGVLMAGQDIDVDRTVRVQIGGRQTLRIDHGTKRLQVFQNDRPVKTFPASLGNPQTPSSSGRLVVMEKLRAADWVYSPTNTLHVEYAERPTADGEFIHAAPWSVADQGRNNVSHGCTNVSTSDGACRPVSHPMSSLVRTLPTPGRAITAGLVGWARPASYRNRDPCRRLRQVGNPTRRPRRLPLRESAQFRGPAARTRHASFGTRDDNRSSANHGYRVACAARHAASNAGADHGTGVNNCSGTP
jgi:lipoprotein-anchoring transpeptidase ErfK/SrfK